MSATCPACGVDFSSPAAAAPCPNGGVHTVNVHAEDDSISLDGMSASLKVAFDEAVKELASLPVEEIRRLHVAATAALASVNATGTLALIGATGGRASTTGTLTVTVGGTIVEGVAAEDSVDAVVIHPTTPAFNKMLAVLAPYVPEKKAIGGAVLSAILGAAAGYLARAPSQASGPTFINNGGSQINQVTYVGSPPPQPQVPAPAVAAEQSPKPGPTEAPVCSPDAPPGSEGGPPKPTP